MEVKRGKWFSVWLLFLVTAFSFAQQKEIKGTVKDVSGLPMPGASVVVKGTQNGTETDFDGHFTIRVSQGETLKISFVGMKDKEVKVGTSTRINVVLEEDSVQLEAVVVTGYGTQNKSAMAGSVQTIKTEQLAQTQSANVVQSLTGKVTGVQIRTTTGQPGAEPSVRFRGIGSISSSNQPLYVVDGVPYNGDISAISSQDIETINFLKDASANALYGSRGANGVIVVTTKKGKQGKLSVSYDSKVGFNTRALPEYDVITDPKEYYELRYERLRLGRMVDKPKETPAQWATFAQDNLVKDLGYNIFDVSNNQIIDLSTGKVNPNANVLYQDNWNDYMFRTSFRNEQFFNIRFGNEKLTSYLSAGYLSDEGYAVNSGFDRYSARLNLDYNLTKSFKVGANLNYAKTTQKDPQAGKANTTFSNIFSWTRNIAPIYPIFARDTKGNYIYDAKGERVYDFGDGETLNNDGSKTSRTYITNQNPYATNIKNIHTNNKNNLSGRFYASVDFLNDFNFIYNLGYDYANDVRIRYAWEGGGDAKGVGGRITNANSNLLTTTHQQLLNWKKSFSNHSLDLMIGHESSDYERLMQSSTKTGVVISGLSHLSNASKIETAESFKDLYRVEGYLSRLGYSYDNKYFVNGSFRRDASSVFHPKNRWGNFFGAGVAWNVTNEGFLPKNKVLTNLKLKASYGEQGNDNIYYPSYVSFDHRAHFDFSRNYLPYLTQYDISKDASGSATTREAYLGNPDLKWEVSRNINAGLEFTLFSRINIEAEYFDRGVSDMLYNFPLALSSGSPSISRNIGDMKNVGFEVSLDADVISTQNTKLNLWANATHYKNKITHLPNPFVSGYFRFVEGESAYTYRLREFAGVDKETGSGTWYQGGADKKTEKVIGDRQITTDATQATYYLTDKTAHPDLYGGFGLNFNYKNWSFATGFSYQLGGYIHDDAYLGLFPESTGMGNSGHNFHKDIYKTWTPENKDAQLPRVTSKDSNQYVSSNLFLIGADYLALENINLSYKLENETISNIGIKSATFSILANNIFVWSKRKGLDPRMSQLGGASNNGTTLNTYSPLRSVSLGVNLNF